MGFRGCPFCPSFHSPLSSLPYSALPTNTRRYENTETLGIGAGGGGKGEKRSAKEEKRRRKVGFDGLIPSYGRSVGFRGVPRSVAHCAHLPILRSPRCHIPPFQTIRRVPNPPKRWILAIRRRDGGARRAKFGKREKWIWGRRSDFLAPGNCISW